MKAKTLTADQIDREFDAAKQICKLLVTRSESSRIRILEYFGSLLKGQTDMEEEYQILRQVAEVLGVRID